MKQRIRTNDECLECKGKIIKEQLPERVRDLSNLCAECLAKRQRGNVDPNLNMLIAVQQRDALQTLMRKEVKPQDVEKLFNRIKPEIIRLVTGENLYTAILAMQFATDAMMCDAIESVDVIETTDQAGKAVKPS